MLREVVAPAALVLVALVAELCALMGVVLASPALQPGRLTMVLAAHLVAAVAIAEAARLRLPRGDPSGLGAWRLGATLAIGLPVYGPLLTILLVVRSPRPTAAKPDADLSPLQRRQQQAEACRVVHRGIKAAPVAGVDSIREALKDDDKARRLGAVEAARQLDGRRAARLLGGALDNTVVDVRFHAADALSGIGQRLAERVERAREELARKPMAAHHARLADLYDEYASLQAEEAAIRQHFYRRALHHYRQASACRGSSAQPELVLKVGRCLEALGDGAGALDVYRELERREPGGREALLGRARVQFQQQDYPGLRLTCQQLARLPRAAGRGVEAEAAAFWAGCAESPKEG
jgi:hypothetical protein